MPSEDKLYLFYITLNYNHEASNQNRPTTKKNIDALQTCKVIGQLFIATMIKWQNATGLIIWDSTQTEPVSLPEFVEKCGEAIPNFNESNSHLQVLNIPVKVSHHSGAK